MNAMLASKWFPILLLCVSNLFMTIAWYGHLKHKQTSLWKVILVSWGIAFFEYVLMVPANRLGHSHYSATELKIIQEVITLVVFTGFAFTYLGESLKWNHFAAFLCVLAAVAFTFLPSSN
ncbi:MAG: DMT family protein [Verrucomicrobiales bacterium]